MRVQSIIRSRFLFFSKFKSAGRAIYSDHEKLNKISRVQFWFIWSHPKVPAEFENSRYKFVLVIYATTHMDIKNFIFMAHAICISNASCPDNQGLFNMKTLRKIWISQNWETKNLLKMPIAFEHVIQTVFPWLKRNHLFAICYLSRSMLLAYSS